MAVTAHVFPQFAQLAMSKSDNWSSDTLMVALSDVTGPVTLSTSGVQAAKTWSDWKTNVAAEITGTGYTAGGVALTGVSLATSGDVATLSCSNPSWTGATFTANQAVFYDSVTGDLVVFWDFGGAVSVTSGTFTLDTAAGIVTATAS